MGTALAAHLADWIDGLETFQRHIQHKGWIGGWLLPQEKSYFALKLPHGWWLFGLDLALVDDIDTCQCRWVRWANVCVCVCVCVRARARQ